MNEKLRIGHVEAYVERCLEPGGGKRWEYTLGAERPRLDEGLDTGWSGIERPNYIQPGVFALRLSILR
jgi:hypothetical protein